MQNFTLGKKGYSMFLFALILLIGSSPSYGQTPCATVADEDSDPTNGNNQTYCYLQTIQNLIDDGTSDGTNTAIFETADTENDTDPIDGDELLTNGEEYFVGSTTAECDRVAVTVTVTAADTPQNSITNSRDSFTISPCENMGYTSGQLKSLFTADDGYAIEVYNEENEFGSTAMADGDLLVAGKSYFVGQVDNNPLDGTDCPSTRAAVGFDPIDALPPNAEAAQTFCDGATVADLVATAVGENVQDIRWYRSITSNTPLDDDEELVHNEDYFAAQVVNERNSPFPPCETPKPERRRVVVEVITFDAGDDVTGEICEDDLRQRIADGEGASILFSFVDDGRDPFPSQVSFDPSLGALAQQFENGATELFTTATFTTPEGCTDDVEFTLTINESYNAGDDNTEGNVVCRAFFSEPTATEAEVEAYLRSLLSDAEGDEIDSDGNFSNDDITTITNLINGGSEGPFTTTYIVGEGEPCEDSADLAFEVDQADDLGTQTGDGIYCQSDIDERIASGPASNDFYRELARQLFLEQLDPGVPQDGTFINMTLDQVVTAYGNGVREFSTTYSITTENGCSSSVNISFDIIEDTNAGDDNLIDNTACRSEFSTTATEAEVQNYLSSLLSNDADTNGDFSNLTSIASRITSGDNGPFNSTYTTGAGTECSDTADFQFSVIDDMPANAGSFNNPTPVCENDNPINLFTDIENNDPEAMETGTFSGMGVTNNVFDPSAVTPGGTYTITYTVSEDPENCITGPESSTTFDITVDPAPISANISRELCVTQAGELIRNESEGYAFVLEILADSGVGSVNPANFAPGTIEEAGALANFIETPSSDTETFNFTYNTPSENSCDDGVINIAITINNTEDAFVDNIADFEVCSSEDSLNLYTYLNLSGGTFSYGTVEIEDGLIDISTIGELPEITYTVNEDEDTTDCIEGTASSTFKVTVVAPVSAGKDKSKTLCRAQVREIYSEGTARNYYLSLLDAGVPRDGTFDPLIQTLVDRYNDSGEKLGSYTSTYTVKDGNCTDSAEVTVVIIANNVVKVGPIANQETCVDGETITLDTLLNADNTTLGGTFSGTGVTNGIFNPATAGVGTFTITYNVTSNTNQCAASNASRSFTIDVSQEASQAEVGTIANQETCVDGETITLATLLNADTTTLSGTFSGTGVTNGFFDPATAGVGTFTITYNVNGDDNACVIGNASGSFTISVTEEATQSEVGDIENQEACIDGNTIDLATLLNANDTTLGGTFTGTGVSNGIFDPATSGVGNFSITYEVIGDDLPCSTGNASGTFTINVTDRPDSPVAEANQSFCLIDGPTVGDIEVTGDNIVFYTDAGLDENDIVDATTALINDTIYYAVSTNDAGSCSSEATEITVTITDPASPTLSLDGNEFCRSDNPTVQELINNFTGGVVIYNASTGGASISSSTPLQNGATYYAASVNGTTGCESSERTAVVAKVEFCGIPEGFSPNGDGINDRFVIPDIAENYPNYTIEFYNRYGNVVYKGNASTPDWDGITNQSGTLGNDVLPVGVYFYILNYNDGQTSPIQGKLYLSR